MSCKNYLGAAPGLRAGFDRFTAKNIEANMPIIELLRQVADREKETPAQVALAWLLSQKPFVVPIPGTRNIDHLNENLEQSTFSFLLLN